MRPHWQVELDHVIFDLRKDWLRRFGRVDQLALSRLLTKVIEDAVDQAVAERDKTRRERFDMERACAIRDAIKKDREGRPDERQSIFDVAVEAMRRACIAAVKNAEVVKAVKLEETQKWQWRWGSGMDQS